MDFDTSIKTHDSKILKSLGVPPILLDGGNNANIAPNLRLFYLETVVPILTKFSSAVERFFGYDIEPVTSSVSALQPEMKDVAAYHSTLVNAGIISATKLANSYVMKQNQETTIYESQQTLQVLRRIRVKGERLLSQNQLLVMVVRAHDSK